MSPFKNLLQFLRDKKGDLANLTDIKTPTHLLAPYSVLELASGYGERPSQFASLGQEPDAERRAVLVLKWMLTSMKSQIYGPEAAQSEGLKKPLNPFLGEIFRARWSDEKATCRLVAEQVSHHPPVTAACLYDDEHGVRASLYSRLAMTFAGAVELRHTGHMLVHIDEFDEVHLCYIPGCTIRGLVTGTLSPEVTGTYRIVSSSGFVTEVNFSGTSFLGVFGKKDSFKATTYSRRDPDKTPLYVAQGCWTDRFTITRAADGEVVHDWDTSLPENALYEAEVRPIAEQDVWESRRAWKGVIDGLRSGDLAEAAAEKSKLEMAQREMRAAEKAHNVAWRPLLFASSRNNDKFDQLVLETGWKLEDDRTGGVWEANRERVKCLGRPFRPGMTPLARFFPGDAEGASGS